MKTKKYICNNICWVGGLKRAMFMPGDIVDFFDDEEVPGHFTCIEPEPEPIKEEPKFEEIKVENPKIEEVKIESSFLEIKEEEPTKRKPKKYGE